MVKELKILLIGHGTVGKMHELKFCESGHKLFFVDLHQKVEKNKVLDKKTVYFQSLSSICSDFFKSIDVFDVCVPTTSHLKVLQEIARQNSSARVLLEKPICDVAELEEMKLFLREEPSIKIYVNSPYRYAFSLLKLLKFTEKFLSKGKKLRSINIEFSKNRTFDECNGRFVDPQGAIGYEFFHILEILSMILSQKSIDVPFFQRCLKDCKINKDYFDIKLRSDDIDIRLSSSMNGNIFLNNNDYISKYGIPFFPMSKHMRYRIVEVVFDSQEKLVILFDPLHINALYYNDIHFLMKYNREGKSVYHVHSDHLKTSLEEGLSSLFSTDTKQIIRLKNYLHKYLEYEEIINALCS